MLVDPSLPFAIDRGPLGAREWSGVCAFIEQIDTEPDGLSLYSVRIVPALWLLSQRRGHRIFQHQSTPAIARALLREHGIETALRLDEAAFPRHEHRVQYGESDLAFLSRLLEDAGISAEWRSLESFSDDSAHSGVASARSCDLVVASQGGPDGASPVPSPL